jgi:cysteinyl-tRNA synthetase
LCRYTAAQFITTILATLGVAETSGGVGFGLIGGDADGGAEGAGASAEEAMAPVLDLVTKFRDQIRALARGGANTQDLMAACDELRDVGLPELAWLYKSNVVYP